MEGRSGAAVEELETLREQNGILVDKLRELESEAAALEDMLVAASDRGLIDALASSEHKRKTDAFTAQMLQQVHSCKERERVFLKQIQDLQRRCDKLAADKHNLETSNAMHIQLAWDEATEKLKERVRVQELEKKLLDLQKEVLELHRRLKDARNFSVVRRPVPRTPDFVAIDSPPRAPVKKLDLMAEGDDLIVEIEEYHPARERSREVYDQIMESRPVDPPSPPSTPVKQPREIPLFVPYQGFVAARNLAAALEAEVPGSDEEDPTEKLCPACDMGEEMVLKNHIGWHLDNGDFICDHIRDADLDMSCKGCRVNFRIVQLELRRFKKGIKREHTPDEEPMVSNKRK